MVTNSMEIAYNLQTTTATSLRKYNIPYQVNVEFILCKVLHRFYPYLPVFDTISVLQSTKESSLGISTLLLVVASAFPKKRRVPF